MTLDPELARLIARADFAERRADRAVDRLDAARDESHAAGMAYATAVEAVTAYRAAHLDAQGELL